MEYLPFGESLVEEHLNSNNSPFRFNAKELDQETGNYYYGARYYDPKFSIWISVDPLAEKFPEWSSYNYVMDNPVKYIDPDGRSPGDPNLIGFIQNGINNLPKNYAMREYMRLVNKVFGFSSSRSNNLAVSSNLKNNKYLHTPSSTASNNYMGSGDFDFFGKKINLNYVIGKRSNLNLYEIQSYYKRGSKKGPFLYGNAMGDQLSGFFIEFNNSYPNKLPSALLQFDSLEELNEVMKILQERTDLELNKLLEKDPFIKEFKAISDFRADILMPLYNELIEKNIDLDSNVNYQNLLNEYNTRLQALNSQKNKLRSSYE